MPRPAAILSDMDKVAEFAAESKTGAGETQAGSSERRLTRPDFIFAAAVSLAVSIPLSLVLESLDPNREVKEPPPEIQLVSGAEVSDPLLRKLGVEKWKVWESSSVKDSRFDYVYKQAESVYILEGEALVTPKDGRRPVLLKPKVFATFPKGLACTWDVKVPVKKFYKEYVAISSFE